MQDLNLNITASNGYQAECRDQSMAETLHVSGIYDSSVKYKYSTRGRCLIKTKFLHSVPLSIIGSEKNNSI